MSTTAVWDSVIGQPSAVAALQAWSADPVHAYLFLGPAGVGKRQAARAFSAAVQGGLHGGDGTAVERQVALALADKHPDVEIHEPAGAGLLVDGAKAVITSVFRKPIDGPRRIVVVDRFHDAQPAAAAALLKTVEEPPPAALIILLAESVPTEHVAIASRCARIDFPPVAETELAAWLARHDVAGERADLLVEAAAGDIGRLSLLVADPGFADRAELWRSVPVTIDGSGATAGRLVRDLTDLMVAAAEPLAERHRGEITELDAREEALGIRGSGRAGTEARHKREQRRLRTDEIRFGLRVLARAYRRALANEADPRRARQYVVATERLRAANDALVRNPNETLLLHNLFWNLPSLER